MKCPFPDCDHRVSLAAQVCPCTYCKRSHCHHHRLPEDHKCPNLREGIKNRKPRIVKPKFVDYSRSGQIGA